MTGQIAILDPLKLPLNGSRLIEASAGTGKTFTIAFLYVRLVLGRGLPRDTPLGQGLLPPNILVVTFTDAATKELRDRIRTRLAQAAEVFAGTEVNESSKSSDLLYQLRNEYDPAEWPACRRKLLLAVEWMDEAAVSTIHAFCNRMLSEHAFDSGSLFKLTLETDQSELFQEVFRDYWRIFVYPLRGIAAQVFTGFWQNPDSLQAALKPLLEHADRIAAGEAAPEQVLQTLHDQISQYKTLWQSHCEDLDEQMQLVMKNKLVNGQKFKSNNWKKWFSDCQDWAADAELIMPALTEAAWKRLCPDGITEVLKQQSDLPNHPALALLEEVHSLSDKLDVQRAAIIQHAVHWSAARLETEKQRRSEMGFNDLLTRLHQALLGPQGEKLAATIRAQFPVALIDEFQDTDPVQYSIFDQIYRVADNHPQTGLLMIGDPKQAIYAFRGADIYTYLSARQATEARTYTLGKNFRSAQSMVAGVNHLFVQADRIRAQGAFLFGSGANTALPFNPVQAQGSARQWRVNGEAPAPLTFWTMEGERDHKDKYQPVGKAAYRETLAEACASEIVRLLNAGQQKTAGFVQHSGAGQMLEPVKPADIAVLVNDGIEAKAVRGALGRRSVKSVYLSDRDSVLASTVAVEIFYWLRAFSEPQQLAAVRAALATPSLGQSYQSLHDLLTDEFVLEREIERFIGYQKLWQTRGILPTIRRFIMDFELPARLLQQADGGERQLTDILHIAELLQEDSQQLDGEHALVHHYAQLLQNSELDEHRTTRLESDAGLVQVITVHKSKGLEFPLVFLPYATNFRAEEGKKSFIKFHDHQQQLCVQLNPDSEQVAQADLERLGEDIRKLYVALTRARYATWVGAAALKNWQQSGLGYLIHHQGEESVTASLTALLGDNPAIQITPVLDATEQIYQPEIPPPLGAARRSWRTPADHWWIASYSAIDYQKMSGTGRVYKGDIEDPQLQNALEHGIADEPVATASDTTQKDQHSFHKGAGPGTFLHEVLEWCAKRGFANIVNNPAPLRQLLQSRCTTRGWDEWVEPLKQWLLQILTQPLPLSATGETCCSLHELKQIKPELEFWFESRNVTTQLLDQLITDNTLQSADRPQAAPDTFNGMFKGFVDLLFEHQGRYYLLDYKSNYLGPDDNAYNQTVMVEKILGRRYDLQYSLYLLALHRLLRARLPDYDYEQHVGGAIYYFLRGSMASGAGAFVDKPPRQLIEQLDELFNGQQEGQAA